VLGNSAPGRTGIFVSGAAGASVRRETPPCRGLGAPRRSRIRLFHCPSRSSKRSPGSSESVNLILTDIPYDGFLPRSRELEPSPLGSWSKAGVRDLQRAYHLNHVHAGTNEHLTYRWVKCSQDPKRATSSPYQILSFWKPILIYSKGLGRIAASGTSVPSPEREGLA